MDLRFVASTVPTQVPLPNADGFNLSMTRDVY